MWPEMLAVSYPEHAEVEDDRRQGALGRLEREGHLLRLPDSRIEGEVELVFRDGSEREGLERAVSPSRRLALHRVIADWLSLHEGSLANSSELVALLARHLARSGSSYRAAYTLLCAARVACSEGADLKAAGYFAQALQELAEQDNRKRVDALLDYGTLLGRLGRPSEARQAFTEMAQLSKRLGLHAKRGAALCRLGRLHREAGELLLARRALERALRAFDAGPDPLALASAQDELGMVLWLLGDRTQAQPLLRAALEAQKRAHDEQGMAASLSGLALVWSDEGRTATSERAAGILAELCERSADAAAKCDALLVRAHLATQRRDLAEARDHYRRSAELALAARDRHRLARSLVRLGVCELRCDDPGRAEESLIRGARLAEEVGALLELAEARRGLAKLALERRQLGDARRYAASALCLARRSRCPLQLASALRTTGDVAAATSRPSAEQRIVRYYMRSITLCKKLGDELELAKGYRAFARFAERFDDREIRRQSEMLRALSDEIFRSRERSDAARA
jgi:tetratricopeptide (TPR) repeat protein